MPTEPTPTRRVGGRSALVAAAVFAAVESLVAEHGLEDVSVPMIADRSGVNASSIYRRWKNVSNVVSEATALRLSPEQPLPDTGTIGQDLSQWASNLWERWSSPEKAALLRAAAGLAAHESNACMTLRRHEAAQLVDRALQRGEQAPALRQVVDQVMAPIVYRIIFEPGVQDETFPRQLVSHLLGTEPTD
jgi:AcrR family transcriptional regulator